MLKRFIKKILGWYVEPIRNENQRLLAANEEILKKLESLEKRVADEEERIERAEKIEQQLKDDGIKNCRELEQHREKIQDQIILHQKLLNGYQEQLSFHQEQLDGHQKQLNSHQEQLDGHQKQLNSHQEQLDGHQKQLNSHQEQLDGHQEQMNGQQEQLDSHQNQLHMHQMQLNDCDARVQTLRDNWIQEYRKTSTLNDERSLKYAVMPYFSLNVEGISYLYNREDREIPNCMIESGKNYAKTDIDNFLRIADSHCYNDQNPQTGFFLDIGGNIGTTTLYCKLKAKPNLQYIAFEPVTENVNLFLANCAVNGIEKGVVVEKVALSNRSRERMAMKIDPHNFGHSKLLSGNDDNEGFQAIETVTLDEYIRESNINRNDIRYIWIDVEGHELEVLEGANALYTQCSIPTCLEFNQDVYLKEGKYEKMLEILESYFKRFAVCAMVAAGDFAMRPIEELSLLIKELDGKPCDLILL